MPSANAVARHTSRVVLEPMGKKKLRMVSASASKGAMLKRPRRCAWENWAAAAAHSAVSSRFSTHTVASRRGSRWCRNLPPYTVSSRVCLPMVYS